ncbi:hypothetical protein HGRIS_001474 [Hohenbuehelia grisea]|uniref:Uncharacterized protein n=1 Tax=Hohenbuehelia grisea TaxID=104357 RepID=A0ABR3JPG0_9AGAR
MPSKGFVFLRAIVTCVSCFLIAGTFGHFWATTRTHAPVAFNDLDLHAESVVGAVTQLNSTTQHANSSNKRPSRPSASPKPSRHYPTPAPRLTIIAIGNPGPQNPLYLPNFFASEAANPSIDLLFIKYDKHRVGCNVPFAAHVPNVREVCLSTEEYWDLHADFLCGHWGGCGEDERKAVVSKLHERAGGDRVNSYFRPFRSAKWIHPDTRTWGWCDMDTILGNFERNLPWDIIKEFDIAFPPSPHDSQSILLFTPGHLAFFRNSAKITTEFMKFPSVKTTENFFNLPWMGTHTEESEYSHFAFTQTSLTFIRFPGMVESKYHLSTLSGVFAIENSGRGLDKSSRVGHSSTRDLIITVTIVMRNLLSALVPASFVLRPLQHSFETPNALPFTQIPFNVDQPVNVPPGYPAGHPNQATRFELTANRTALYCGQPGDVSSSGYAHFTSNVGEEDKHMFWWLYEARHDPDNAPIALLFGGGSRGSGQLFPLSGAG